MQQNLPPPDSLANDKTRLYPSNNIAKKPTPKQADIKPTINKTTKQTNLHSTKNRELTSVHQQIK